VFDDIIKAIEGVQGEHRISIQLPLDEDGYLDRSCPNDQCQSDWKILFSDWEAKVPDERAICPICGHDDEPAHFSTTDAVRRLDELLRVAPRLGVRTGVQRRKRTRKSPDSL